MFFSLWIIRLLLGLHKCSMCAAYSRHLTCQRKYCKNQSMSCEWRPVWPSTLRNIICILLYMAHICCYRIIHFQDSMNKWGIRITHTQHTTWGPRTGWDCDLRIVCTLYVICAFHARHPPISFRCYHRQNLVVAWMLRAVSCTRFWFGELVWHWGTTHFEQFANRNRHRQ